MIPTTIWFGRKIENNNNRIRKTNDTKKKQKKYNLQMFSSETIMYSQQKVFDLKFEIMNRVSFSMR